MKKKLYSFEVRVATNLRATYQTHLLNGAHIQCEYRVQCTNIQAEHFGLFFFFASFPHSQRSTSPQWRLNCVPEPVAISGKSAEQEKGVCAGSAVVVSTIYVFMNGRGHARKQIRPELFISATQPKSRRGTVRRREEWRTYGGEQTVWRLATSLPIIIYVLCRFAFVVAFLTHLRAGAVVSVADCAQTLCERERGNAMNNGNVKIRKRTVSLWGSSSIQHSKLNAFESKFVMESTYMPNTTLFCLPLSFGSADVLWKATATAEFQTKCDGNWRGHMPNRQKQYFSAPDAENWKKKNDRERGCNDAIDSELNNNRIVKCNLIFDSVCCWMWNVPQEFNAIDSN